MDQHKISMAPFVHYDEGGNGEKSGIDGGNGGVVAVLPLYAAVICDDADAVKLLLEHGADPNASFLQRDPSISDVIDNVNNMNNTNLERYKFNFDLIFEQYTFIDT